MSSRTSARAAIAALAVVVYAVPAAALEGLPGWYAGVQAGGLYPLAEWSLGSEGGASIAEAPGGLVGLHVGRRVARWLSVEPAIGAVLLRSEVGAGNAVLHAAADLAIYDGQLATTGVRSLSPALTIGAGLFQTLAGDLGNDNDFEGHAGLGLRMRVDSPVVVRVELRGALTDGAAEELGWLVGLVAGVDLYPGATLPAPPESDGDDSQAREADRCPDTTGLAPRPDGDGDAVADGEDRCPQAAGLPALQGCPDGDGDMVADGEDRCPQAAGLSALQGCPDLDADGVADEQDRCPEVAGVAGHQGCPPPRVVVEEAVQQITIQEEVRFRTDEAVIDEASNSLLDEVAQVISAHPEIIRVRIEGHTDNQGHKQRNLKLSQRRAEAVLQYLVGAGVARARLEAKGYGSSRPIADNGTPDGQARNRRVVFAIMESRERGKPAAAAGDAAGQRPPPPR